MPFTIPNLADASYPVQANLFSTHIAALVAGIDGAGVVSGCAVTAQGSPNMTVAVAAGQVRFNDILITVASGNVTVDTAHATNPRIDLVVVSNAGVKDVFPGSAAASPVPPAIPANHVLLAELYVDATTTTITSAKITDKRVFVQASPVASDMLSLMEPEFGAVGDGTTDDTTAVSAWLDALNSRNKAGFVPARTFSIGQIIKTGWVTGPRIIGAPGATFQMRSGIGGQGPMFGFLGVTTGENALNDVVANVVPGATSITLDTGRVAAMGIVADDIIQIGKNVPWSTEPANGRPFELIGQAVRVASVAGDVVTLSEPVVLPYNTADTVLVEKYTMPRGLHIENITFVGIYSGTVRLVDIRYCRDVVLKNVVVRDNGSMGILLHDCYGFYADVKAYDLADDTANEKYGYGLCVQAACANGIVDVGGERCRHVFTTNGWWGVDNLGGYGGVNNLIIRGSASQCSAEGMDTHGSGTNIIFYGCHLEGNVGGGLQSRSPKTMIVGCYFAANKHHLKLGWCATDNQIIGCTFEDTYTFGDTNDRAAAVRVENEMNSQFLKHTVFKGCTFRNIYADVVRFGTGGAHTTQFDFEDCTFSSFGVGNISSQQAVFRAYSTTLLTSNLSLRRCTVRSLGAATAPVIFFGPTAFTGSLLIEDCAVDSNIAIASTNIGTSVLIRSEANTITFVDPLVPTTITNMAAAITEFPNGTNARTIYDFRSAGQVRLVARVNTIGSTTAALAVQYSTNESTWLFFDATSSYTAGTTPGAVVIGGGSAGTRAGTWYNLPAAIKASDMFLRLVTVSGDGAADPVVGRVDLQVR